MQPLLPLLHYTSLSRGGACRARHDARRLVRAHIGQAFQPDIKVTLEARLPTVVYVSLERLTNDYQMNSMPTWPP